MLEWVEHFIEYFQAKTGRKMMIYTSHFFSTLEWLGFIAYFFLFLVLYRNKLQFKGWYESKNNKKLSKTTTISLTAISVLLIVMPIIFAYVPLFIA